MAHTAGSGLPVPPDMAPTAFSWRGHIVRQLKLRDTEQRETFRDLIRFCEHSSPGENRSDQCLCEQLASIGAELRLFAAGPEAAVEEDRRRRDWPSSSFRCSEPSDPKTRFWRSSKTGMAAVSPPLPVSPCLTPQAAAAAVSAGRGVCLAPAAAAASGPPAAGQLVSEVRVRCSAGVPAPDRVQSAEGGERGPPAGRPRPPEATSRHPNEPSLRVVTRQACVQNDLQTVPRSNALVDPSSGVPAALGPNRDQEHPSLVRSASARSTRFLVSLSELFRKRRGHSVSSLDEDLWRPVRGGVARLPAQALHVLEAHEQGVNAVQFSPGSDTLATGGTDRVIKLWEVSAGWLTHTLTLEGSTDGITCVEFDPAGLRVLAASYDKSALLWRLDDAAPKLTLTGHSRKVTSARFRSLHQVATGSADGTVRLWDLRRAACVQLADAASSCSDLLCCDSSFISGHFDGRVRVWDPRMSTVVQQFPALGKVTSLDVTPDHRQLLICCRDDCLQLTDLRMQRASPACFRADGFSCGSDCTRAVLSPDGCFAAAGSADGAVYVWGVSSGRLETRLPDRHRSAVDAVSWSASGEHLVSVDKSRRAVLWSHA
ncbi:autophagy-related protein 16-1-like [Neosynchiropus ocellatus]